MVKLRNKGFPELELHENQSLVNL